MDKRLQAVRRRWVAGLIVALASLALAGCGNDGAGSATAAGGGGGGAGVTTTTTGAGAATDAVTVAIDRTTALSGSDIAGAYRDGAARLLDPVLVSGGHLRLVVFAGAGIAPAVLYDQAVPTEQELTGTARDRFVVAARGEIRGLLDQALGLAAVKPGSTMDVALQGLKGDGSDVAGAILGEVDELGTASGGELDVFSDGLQRSDGVDFSASIDHLAAVAAAKLLAPLMPPDAHSTALRIRGVGLSGHIVNVTTPRAAKLAAAWTQACHDMHAKACDIKPGL